MLTSAKMLIARFEKIVINHLLKHGFVKFGIGSLCTALQKLGLYTQGRKVYADLCG